MSNPCDLRPYEPRAATTPPFSTDSRCWYRFFSLDPLFQRFIIPDLGHFELASCVIGREVYITTELLHHHSAEDTDWLHGQGLPASVEGHDPAHATAPRSAPELYRWWPLAKLEPNFIKFLFIEIADDPSLCTVIDGTVYVSRNHVDAYVAGDSDWLWEDASSCEPIFAMSL